MLNKPFFKENFSTYKKTDFLSPDASGVVWTNLDFSIFNFLLHFLFYVFLQARWEKFLLFVIMVKKRLTRHLYVPQWHGQVVSIITLSLILILEFWNIVKIDSITYSFYLCHCVWNGLSYSAEETQLTLCKNEAKHSSWRKILRTNKHQLLHRIQSIRIFTNLQKEVNFLEKIYLLDILTIKSYLKLFI